MFNKPGTQTQLSQDARHRNKRNIKRVENIVEPKDLIISVNLLTHPNIDFYNINAFLLVIKLIRFNIEYLKLVMSSDKIYCCKQ